MLRRYFIIIFLAINFAFAQGENVNESIEKHIKKLQSTNSRGKLSSIIALGKLGPKAKDAVPELIKHLEHKNTRIVLWSIRSLQKIGVAGMPELEKALQSSDKNVQCMILRVLEGMEAESLSTLPDMTEFLQDDDPCIQEHTLKILTVVPDKGTHCVSRLLQLVVAEESEIKILAAQVLGLLGERTLDTARVLIEVLEKENRDENVCATIVVALAQVGKDKLPLILEAFANNNIRLHIVRVLGLINIVKKETVAPLIVALQDDNARIKLEARRVLQNMGVSVVPFLVQELRNEKVSLVASLLGILENIRAPLIDAVPVLLDLTMHKNVDVAEQAKKVLLKIDIQHTAPKFLMMLRSNSLSEARIGFDLLHKLHGDSVPWLMEALKDDTTLRYVSSLLGKQILLESKSNVYKTVTILIEHLKDKDVRSRVKKVLLSIEEPVIKELIKFLATNDKVLLEEVKLFLKETSRKSIYLLFESLDDPELEKQSLSFLMELPAKDARHVIDASVRYARYREMSSKSKRITVKILKSMGIYGTITVIKKLADARLGGYLLMDVLESLDTSSAELIPDICNTIKHTNPKFRVRLLRILAKMGAEAKTALPTIDSILEDCTWAVKIEALETLAAIGKDALPKLIDLFHKGDSRLKMHVAQKLCKMVPERVDEITGYHQKVYEVYDEFKKVEEGIIGRYIHHRRSLDSRYLEFALAFSESNTPVFCFAIRRVKNEYKIVLYDVDKKEQRNIFTENIAVSLAGPRSDADLRYLKELQCISKLELHSEFIGDKGFYHLQNFKNLTALRIFSPCKITKNGLVSLQKLPNLKELWLHVDLTEGELALLQNLPQLQSLYLRSSQAINFSILAGFSGLTKLSLLKMHNGGIKHLERLSNLKSLGLLNMKISEDDIKELSNCKNLETLSLSMSTISDKHVGHLSKMQKLSTLDLSRTMMSDVGMKVVNDWQNITTLSIAYTAVTDEGVLLLKDNLRLRNLYISPNISRKTIKVIKENMKACHITIVR